MTNHEEYVMNAIETAKAFKYYEFADTIYSIVQKDGWYAASRYISISSNVNKMMSDEPYTQDDEEE